MKTVFSFIWLLRCEWCKVGMIPPCSASSVALWFTCRSEIAVSTCNELYKAEQVLATQRFGGARGWSMMDDGCTLKLFQCVCWAQVKTADRTVTVCIAIFLHQVICTESKSTNQTILHQITVRNASCTCGTSSSNPQSCTLLTFATLSCLPIALSRVAWQDCRD